MSEGKLVCVIIVSILILVGVGVYAHESQTQRLQGYKKEALLKQEKEFEKICQAIEEGNGSLSLEEASLYRDYVNSHPGEIKEKIDNGEIPHPCELYVVWSTRVTDG